MKTESGAFFQKIVIKYSLAWQEKMVYSLCRLNEQERKEYMAKYLVIVESPAKAKTIKKFLGSNYEVIASNGHVRDLPKSQMGIDVDNDFEPKYITIRGKGDILAQLRKEVKKADKVYLATDPDREGEAISYHLSKALKLDDKKYKRITFNEITKNAVKNSIKQARDIDMALVDAQQARRVLDRLVGYKISPLLWAKIKRGLSAGRVQSVALRMICDREAEIEAFAVAPAHAAELRGEGVADRQTVAGIVDKRAALVPMHRRVHGSPPYHSSEPSSGMTSFMAGIATSIIGSSGSNTVRC